MGDVCSFFFRGCFRAGKCIEGGLADEGGEATLDSALTFRCLGAAERAAAALDCSGGWAELGLLSPFVRFFFFSFSTGLSPLALSEDLNLNTCFLSHHQVSLL